MLSNSLKRLNKTNKLITIEDMSDSLLAGKSSAHTQCWKYLQLASYDSALEHALNIIRREPEKPDGYIFKAKSLYKLKRFKEAEEVLLQVMKIVKQNDLHKTDVEGMIKLKDELANARVEILRSFNFRDPIDIAEMHWNDCNQSILELIGFNSVSNSRKNPSQKTTSHTPMEVDIEIVDIIGAERAKQIYPEILSKSPKSAKEFSTYSTRRALSSSNINISGEFPERDKKKTSFNSSRSESNIDKDVELRTAGLRTALMLAEEKNHKYERKVADLEEELKSVYTLMIKMKEEKKLSDEKAVRLEEELNSSRKKVTNHSPRVRVFTNSNRDRERVVNRPYNGGQFKARFAQEYDNYGMNFRYEHNL